MDLFKAIVLEKRPNLSKSSVNTYASILRNLYSRIWGGSVDISKLDDTEIVLNHLKDIPPSRRKTILSSLVIVTDKQPYREQMQTDVRSYNEDIQLQHKTSSQESNWVDSSNVSIVFDTLKSDADALYKKKTLSPSDLQTIQNYIILALLGGMYIVPRRSKDFVDFKIKNIDKTKDNYLDKSKMVFNSYKTAKTYGQQSIDIPIQLKNILMKWIKLNPTEYLLFDTNFNKLTSVKLNQRLNKIFENKKVGVNQLRHTYLTDKYKETSRQLKSLSKDMSDMGSSASMEANYIKLN